MSKSEKKSSSKYNFKQFEHAYCSSIPDEDLKHFKPEFHANILKWQFDNLNNWSQSKPDITISNAQKSSEGFDHPRTLISILSEDMAFIVDSVIATLTSHGYLIENTVHPVLYIDGAKISDEPTKNSKTIAAFFIELTRRLTTGQINALEKALTQTMRDVRDGTRDWLKIKDETKTAREKLSNATHISKDDLNEYLEFADYVHDDNFTLLGSTHFNLSKKGIGLNEQSGLGLLNKSRVNDFLLPEDLAFIEKIASNKSVEPITVSKLSVFSSVHRHVPLDLILIAQYDKKGALEGLFALIGLFTSVTYSRSLRGIPYLRLKSAKIIAKAEFEENSHDARALRHIVEKYPRDELFQMDSKELYKACLDIMKLQERPRIALYVRPDAASRFTSALIYVPRDRYDTRLRLKFQHILEQELNADTITFTSTVDDSHLVRLLFSLKPKAKSANISASSITKIEDLLQKAGRSWSEQLHRALNTKLGDQDKAAQMVELYGAAFPISYQESFTPEETVIDIQKIEQTIQTGKITIDFSSDDDNNENLSLKIYVPKSPLSLSDILPILENMGLKVIAEYPYEVTPLHDGIIWVQDIHAVKANNTATLSIKDCKDIFETGLLSIWDNTIENDRLNQLILYSNLHPRRVTILRTYVRYARQSRMPYSLAYLEQAVTEHPAFARLLVELFEEKFDPKKPNRKKIDQLHDNALSYLESVKSIDQDRILRALLGTIDATLRTNFYQDKAHISIKLDVSKTPELPEPKPYREIFVYAPNVEGVHLRGDKIARGGLRWSDRHEDFRTEVLGLMKAQQVKNSVIVPMGAKGGFVVKNPPKTNDRAAIQAEGIRCYQTFIRGLLDITDNQKGGKIIPPQDVVRHDNDDPYLVVAADKGTATFSDIANALSIEYGFWLGDAFASGGSAGYDHKKMGITARGSWESVKRHFREMNINTQTTEFDVIGVGDMGGDVFGNGLLQSEYSRLIAAFNHIHIFIDPNPNAKTSYKERLRLFNDVKGWDQYNEKLLSKGGRIYNRSDKVLKLTPEICARFGISQKEIAPNELIQILLKAQTDLLYFGGIGTYIKASTESHQDVGDRSNDNLRVNADEIRARVIGEGANLAITQRARVEYALCGGRVNTDFIDNSAGVDTSDHEVNIKILLSSTKLTGKPRDNLLKDMTDSVAALVLRDNYQQTQALSLMELQAHETLLNDAAFMNSLQRDGLLNKRIEFLPTDDEITKRLETGKGLTRPELSLILSYAKIVFTQELLKTNLPSHPDMQDWLITYFPPQLQTKFRKEILDHRLSDEIVATMISNGIINRMGPTFVRLTMDKTGCSAEDVTKAFLTVRDSFGLRPLWDKVEELDNKAPALTQLKALRKISRLAQRETAWFLTKLGRKVRRAEDGKIFGDGVQKIRTNLAKILPNDIANTIKEQESIWQNDGLPKDLAHEIALFKILGSVPDIIHITQKYKADILNTAEIYFHIGSLFKFDWLRAEAKKLHGDNEWSRAAIAGVLDSLYAAQANLTIDVLKQSQKSKGKAALDAWKKAHEKDVGAMINSITHLAADGYADLAMLTVLEQRLRTLV